MKERVKKGLKKSLLKEYKHLNCKIVHIPDPRMNKNSTHEDFTSVLQSASDILVFH